MNEKEHQEIENIQQCINEACKTAWDELVAIPKEYGYDEPVSSLLVVLALQSVFFE